MTLVRLPMLPTRRAALEYCEAHGLRVLLLEVGPDGTVRGIATPEDEAR